MIVTIALSIEGWVPARDVLHKYMPGRHLHPGCDQIAALVQQGIEIANYEHSRSKGDNSRASCKGLMVLDISAVVEGDIMAADECSILGHYLRI